MTTTRQSSFCVMQAFVKVVHLFIVFTIVESYQGYSIRYCDIPYRIPAWCRSTYGRRAE